MSQLIPALAATIIPAALCLGTALCLRGQSGRHSPGLLHRVPAGWNPLTVRELRAVAHYAGRQRHPFVNTVNTGGVR